MEENKDIIIYTRTIEDIEKITFVVIVHENSFSFYCLKKFEWKIRLLKPYLEDLPFRQFDAILDLYETAINQNTKGLWTVVQKSLKKSVFYRSYREEGAIEKKLYYERAFAPCPPDEQEAILERIAKLKDEHK